MTDSERPMSGYSGPTMSRRQFLGASAALLGVAAAPGLLAACGGGGSTDAASDAGGELLVWYWGEQEAPGMKDFFEGAVDKYNQAGRDKAGDVRAVLQESDTLYTAFRTAAKAKKGPDVQYLWGGTQALEDVWMGNIAPLNDLLPQTWLDKVDKDARRETFWNGEQWGLPFYELNTAWAYNKKMFERANLDPENPPQQWDDFIAALTALKKSGVVPLGVGFKDAWLGGWLISYFGAQNFDSVDDALAPFRGDVEFSGEKYVGWLEPVKELIDRGFFNDDVLSLDLYQGEQLFEIQKAAITNSAQPQIVGFQRKLGTDTVGVMLSPAWGQGKLARFFPGASQVLTVTSFSPRKDRAAQFLQYLHEPAVMKAMYDASGAISPDTRFDPAWLNTDVDKQMAKLKPTLPSIWYQYYYPFPFERDGVTPGLQQLFQPQGSVKTAVDMMQQAIATWQREQPAQVDAYKKWTLLG